ncbi:hypothetical protein FOLKNPGA_01694 [Legionella sp. PC1000]|uniref:ankyrin repeat domain-containing protein n=1 Tax=Legionella sp. PC1000 TaxID=2746060 RepID=UPI0015F9F672|nr:ankyrin repeat domain-containing protein [Legionella sp. PC1000]QLZ68914.1 hypothetical protein FOLKNPGA_01694 [Legionella sp. PC1000]
MADIIDLMKELEYPTNEEGVCLGLAVMAERARHCGQYEQFKERMEYLEGLNNGTLKSLLCDAKETAKRNEVLTQEEKILLSIEPFFFQIWCYFKPRAVQKFFQISGPHFKQDDIPRVEKLIHQDFLLAKSDRFFLSTEPEDDGTYDQGRFLTQFLHVIQEYEECGLLIACPDHMVHLYYDKKQSKWYLTDHSRLSNYERVDELLKPLIDVFTDNGVTNLSIQVFAEESPDKQELLKKLNQLSMDSVQQLKESDNPHRFDTNWFTALSNAALNDHYLVIENLLNNRNVNINLVDGTGKTPLGLTAQNGNKKATEVLLLHPDILVNKGNSNGYPPLWSAANGGYLGVVKALLTHPDILVNKRKRGCVTPLAIAARKGHLDVVETFLKHPDILVNEGDKNDITPLLIAVASSHLDVVKALLKHPDIDVNLSDKDGVTPLWMAAYNGHFDVVQVLVNHPNIKVNLTNQAGCTPLWIAVQNGHLNIVKILQAHSDILVNLTRNDDEISALWIATQRGHLDIVLELLLHPTIDVNQPNKNGVTPLWVAACNGRLDILQALLKHPQIKINKAQKDGIKPIDIAKYKGHQDIVDALENHQESNQRDKDQCIERYDIDHSKEKTLMLRDNFFAKEQSTESEVNKNWNRAICMLF